MHWVLVSHPMELLRSTSSGKLLAQVLGGEFLAYGAPCHRDRLDHVLGDPRVRVLFPDEASESVAEAAASLASASPMPTGASMGRPYESASVVVLVPDGSWEHARALLRALRKRQPALRTMRLRDASVKCYFSPLIDVLKHGAGKGRVSTFEACALLMEEAAHIGVWGMSGLEASKALHSIRPLVDAVATELHVDGPCRPVITPREGEDQVERWISALQECAQEAACVAGLKRCCLCGVALSTPVRMQAHITGRRHCLAVLQAFLSERTS